MLMKKRIKIEFSYICNNPKYQEKIFKNEKQLVKWLMKEKHTIKIIYCYYVDKNGDCL